MNQARCLKMLLLGIVAWSTCGSLVRSQSTDGSAPVMELPAAQPQSGGAGQGQDGNQGGGEQGSSPAAPTAISGNPAAVNVLVGSGALGDALGINRDGFRFGGINISDVNGQFTGGFNPGQWTGDSLTILDFSLDTEKCYAWKGGMFGLQLLGYGGGNVNNNAGTVMGYNSLDVVPPRSRVEVYQLWYRQALLDNKLIVRIGKSVPTYDFNNVTRAVPMGDQVHDIPSVTGALFTPVYVSPTQLGVMPGYYNSATGVVVSAIPNKHVYAQYGLFDGTGAAGRQTGMEGPHFDGYNFHVAEGGACWQVGPEKKPGKVGAGYWYQSGLLAAPSGPVQGADGYYMFASQRLYYEQPGVKPDGLSTWIQYAATDSDFIQTHRYVGWGLTYFAPLTGRDNDSAGFGVAYGRMNNDPAAGLGSKELIYTWYYQAQVMKNCYVQPNFSYISTPAQTAGLNDVFAVTLRAIFTF